MRKFIGPLILLTLLLGAILIWRWQHPSLTDDQQIALATENICTAADNRNSRGITDQFSKEFKFGGMDKKEFQNSIVGGILQFRVIDLNAPNPQIKINGETAQSSGNFSLNLKSEFNSPPQITQGKYNLKWKKIDGEWLIVGAEMDQPMVPIG